ncbi:MAG: pitrilysin family protein [Ignavibacteriaceae bacterium]
MNEVNRKLKPLPKEEIEFSLPEIQSFALDNKLKVFFVQKNELPILQLNLVVNAGGKFDPIDKKGLANLTAMAIDEGAGKYDALELSDEFDTLGSHFNVGTSQDNIFLTLQTLKEHFERSFDLFSIVLLKPHFNEKDFDREKRKVLIKLLQLKDEPDQIADAAYEYLIFGKDNPYSSITLGDEKSVVNISNEDIKLFYNLHFRPDNSSLIIVGDSNLEELKEYLNLLLVKWKPENVTSFQVSSSARNKTQIFIVHKEGAVQSEIRVGHLSLERNEKDYYEKNLLNNILGGQFSSRINLNLREKRGYTYGASSRFTYYRNAAHFIISTSVGSENTGNAVKEIINELRSIRNGVDEKELEFAKSSIIRKFPSNFETNKQIASHLTAKYIFSLPDDYFNNYIEKIMGVSLEGVKLAAEENIFPEEAVVLIVGDKNKVAKQLEGLGLGDTKIIEYP